MCIRDSYDASFAARTNQLKRQLVVAENRLRSTADPKLTVVTMLELISTYNKQPAQFGSVAKAIRQLERELASGCDHAIYGAEWQAVLSENNLSCKDLRSPALFSSFDF